MVVEKQLQTFKAGSTEPVYVVEGEVDCLLSLKPKKGSPEGLPGVAVALRLINLHLPTWQNKIKYHHYHFQPL